MSRQVGASKKRRYSPSKLEQAVNMVESGTMSRKKAALTFDVPRTTLIDKLSGRYKLGSLPGRRTVLSKAEEECLVDYCKLMGSIGYPLKRCELLAEVKRVLDHDTRQTPFKDNMPGKDWFYGFSRRHPELSERTAMTLGHQRALINQEMIEGWFGGLKEYLQKDVPDWEDLLKDPRRSFNADESGFPLCINTGKVLAERGARHVYQVTSSTKQQLTVMACFNAFGQYVPPLIVFPGERMRDTGIHDFPEAIYGQTSNGWMDSELFVEFLKHLNSFIFTNAITKPVILYVDGHSTHMSLEAATYCSSNEIILYCLFPNATHVLQPCDVGFFGPMKSAWKKEVKEWHMENIGQAFTKKHFPAVFKKAWYRVAKLENAVHGFERCGLFPLRPENIDASKLNPSKLHANSKASSEVASESVSHSTSSHASATPSFVDSISITPCSFPIPASVGDSEIEMEVLPIHGSFCSQNLSVSVTSSETQPSDHSMKEVPQVSSVATSFPASILPIVSDLPHVSESREMAVPTPPLMHASQSGNINHASVLPLRSISTTYTLNDAEETTVQHATNKCFSSVIITNTKENYVSPSFSLLNVPEIPKKKQTENIRKKLPKALSGVEALKMLKEREEKKIAEAEAKIKRKTDREEKRRHRIEAKEQKKSEREEIKKKKDLLKKAKDLRKKKAPKRVKSGESSSDSEKDMPKYADSEEDFDETTQCPGCQSDEGTLDEWVGCGKCRRRWHISCTGDALLLEIPFEQVKEYPFLCEYCIN